MFETWLLFTLYGIVYLSSSLASSFHTYRTPQIMPWIKYSPVFFLLQKPWGVNGSISTNFLTALCAMKLRLSQHSYRPFPNLSFYSVPWRDILYVATSRGQLRWRRTRNLGGTGKPWMCRGMSKEIHIHWTDSSWATFCVVWCFRRDVSSDSNARSFALPRESTLIPRRDTGRRRQSWGTNWQLALRPKSSAWRVIWASWRISNSRRV